ncbi:YbaY family lipoprotein [Paracoccus aminovorans]|uniref:YbaY family lipoprotein n=1 Tax=Paracoccus aminovorans TaxID=34004 RepID=UPI002B262B62|nr:YbaY family lipoprotein [Paracoccus aminovorans]
MTGATGAALLLALAACESPGANRVEGSAHSGAGVHAATIRGTVTYREPMALPPEALVRVSLVDVSLADAASPTIAAIEIRPQGQVPVPFALSYDPQRIEDRHSYALRARISSHDGLLFITTTMNPISTGGADNADLVLERVGG